jgi:hypothetical protein
MFGSRTIKTLAALLAAMTAGAISLMVLEKAPLRPAVAMAATPRPATLDNIAEIVRNGNDVPLSADMWHKIIIHTTGRDEIDDIASRCHFVIKKGQGSDECTVEATDLWRRQAPGRHVLVTGFDHNYDSIAICIEGDFAQGAPTNAQFDALVKLVQTLQGKFGIGPSRVYLHRDVDARSKSPGDAFPADKFADSLLASR